MAQVNDQKLSREQENERSLKRRDRGVIFLFVAGFILSLGLFLWQFLQRPVMGIVGVGKAGQQDSAAPGKEPERFIGTYVSFSYPGGYEGKKHDLPQSGPIQESVFLSTGDVEGKKIALVAEKRESSAWGASPAYLMRLNHPKVYQRASIRWNGLVGALFTQSMPVFEQTAFFHENNSFLSVSVTSPFSLDPLRENLEDILQNLDWKTE